MTDDDALLTLDEGVGGSNPLAPTNPAGGFPEDRARRLNESPNGTRGAPNPCAEVSAVFADTSARTIPP